MSTKITIIDYQMSNIFSIKNLCEHLNVQAVVTSDPDDVLKADALILPGVGAFAEAIKNLDKIGMIDPIKDFIKTGKQFLGICLGLQLLFSESNEFGLHKGLDIIKGNVVKIPEFNFNGEKLRVPNVGWNSILKCKSSVNNPLADIENGEDVYFVHSYYVQPLNTSDILTTTNYSGVEFCSSILRDNVFATQFHPEKSGKIGVKIVKNWIDLI